MEKEKETRERDNRVYVDLPEVIECNVNTDAPKEHAQGRHAQGRDKEGERLGHPHHRDQHQHGQAAVATDGDWHTQLLAAL
jgi:hypothetical protein